MSLRLKRFVDSRKRGFGHNHFVRVENGPFAVTNVFEDIRCGESSNLFDSLGSNQVQISTLSLLLHSLFFLKELLSLPGVFLFSCYLLLGDFLLCADDAVVRSLGLTYFLVVFIGCESHGLHHQVVADHMVVVRPFFIHLHDDGSRV